MKTILLALALLLVAGCATDPKAVKAVADANRDIAKTPTFQFECPEAGCTIKKFTYIDPNNRQFVKMPTNGWDAAMSLGRDVKDLAAGALPLGAIGYVAKKGFEAAGHNSTSMASGNGASTGGDGSASQVGPNSANQANTTSSATTTATTNTASGTGASTGGQGSAVNQPGAPVK